MKSKIPIFLAALFGVILLGEACFVGYIYFRGGNSAATSANSVVQPTPVNVTDDQITLLTLETTYKGFFPADSKCAKSYDDLWGKDTGVFNGDSACVITLSFTAKGFADKIIDIQKWDAEKKAMGSAEKMQFHTSVSSEQFRALSAAIINSDTFKNWNDRVSVNTVNTKITVQHPHGARKMMSYVDKSPTAFLQLMDAFKKLDSALNWQDQ